MLRYKVLVTVYRKDEESGAREIDFPYTEQEAQGIAGEIELLLHGHFLVGPDGDIYQLSISSVGEA